MFFDRLEAELPEVNLLQTGVRQVFIKAQQGLAYYNQVSAYKLTENHQSDIVFVQSANQYYQTLKILENLLPIIDLKPEFPFEHLLMDCIIYG